MSFLDNFSWAFQDIKLFVKTSTPWKYWEEIVTWEIETSFLWVIQEKKDFSQYFIEKNENLGYSSKDFELRCPSNIIPKKWDRIESSWNSYNVIYFESVIIEWNIDHNTCTLRLNS
jgi:hypothetical protein